MGLLSWVLAAQAESSCPVVRNAAQSAQEPSSQGQGCPVKARDKPNADPRPNGASGASGCGSESSGSGGGAASSSGCPVMRSGGGSDGVASASAINPLNMMPAPNQERAEGQSTKLGTERVESTIPNAEGGNWVYPSPQMFYNSLLRKGKAAGVQEDAMDAVVAIHNNMNENTWREVMAWEERYHGECTAPRKLVRFMGRPDELSPKAAAKYYLGLSSRPFDRHDWTIDRCGEHVRYIIDYYDVAAKRGQDRVPQLHEVDAVPSIEVDVRPAIDSPTALLDRVRSSLAQLALPVPATVTAQDAPTEREHSEPAASAAAGTRTEMGGAGTDEPGSASLPAADSVRRACAEQLAALQACDSERTCSLAHIGVTMCIAQQVCADEAALFSSYRGVGSDTQAAERAAESYERMHTCVEKWAAAAQQQQ